MRNVARDVEESMRTTMKKGEKLGLAVMVQSAGGGFTTNVLGLPVSHEEPQLSSAVSARSDRSVSTHTYMYIVKLLVFVSNLGALTCILFLRHVPVEPREPSHTSTCGLCASTCYTTCYSDTLRSYPAHPFVTWFEFTCRTLWLSHVV